MMDEKKQTYFALKNVIYYISSKATDAHCFVAITTEKLNSISGPDQGTEQQFNN